MFRSTLSLNGWSRTGGSCCTKSRIRSRPMTLPSSGGMRSRPPGRDTRFPTCTSRPWVIDCVSPGRRIDFSGPDSSSWIEGRSGSTGTNFGSAVPTSWIASSGGSCPLASKGRCCKKNGRRFRRRIEMSRCSARPPQGLAGDPYALDDSQCALVCRLEEALNGAVFEEAVAVMNVHHLETDLAAITAAVEAGKSTCLPLERLRSIRPRVLKGSASPDREPWAAGYALARHVRRELDLDGTPLSSMADLAIALSEDPDRLAEVTRSRDFGAAILVDGVVTSNDTGLPAFAVRSGRDHTRRFQFCRGLAEVLASPDSDALVTRAQSDRQQRSRAFAAEFLVPSAALRTRVSRPVLDEDDVDELAAEFGVSSWTVAHQLRNHGIARIG